MAEIDVRKRYAKYENVLLTFYLERDFSPYYHFEGEYPRSRYWEFHKFHTLIQVLTPTGVKYEMNGRKNQQFTQIEFVNIDWQDKHENEFEAWQKKHENDWHTLVSDMCANQIKFGLSWDDNNACYIVSVTCRDEKDANGNKSYTARSDDWVEALQIALFKHYVITKGDWSSGATKRIRG